MTTTSAALTEAEVSEMSVAALRIHLERCTRLVAHASLLQRLPDKGESIRHRHALFTAELQKREAASTVAAAAAEATSARAEQNERRREHEDAKLTEAVLSSADVAREMGEKYRHDRVSVEKTVRSMYEGAISEAELQRIILSVPPGYFLTYEETCAMERKLAKEARKAELQKLAAEAARQSLAPQ